MYNIPCNKDLLQASSVPLATVITPFAETGPSEVSINNDGNGGYCSYTEAGTLKRAIPALILN